MSFRWGIDLGGTKIEGAVIDVADPTHPICRLRVPTEADKGYDHILAQCEALIAAMDKEAGKPPDSIGFGTPGVLDPQKLVMKNCNTVALNGRALQSDLEERIQRRCVLANDANCFALAEAKYGAAKGAATVFGVIIGTGVGGGLVVNGQILSGLQGIAGEWGHNVLEPEGEPCYCGKRGCVETVLSGPGLERYFDKLTWQKPGLQEIVRLARSGEDEDAVKTLKRLTEMFGKGLSVVIDIFDPEVVVLGGGVGNIDELYTDGLKSLAKWVFNDVLHTRVVRPELGDSAGVFGAALMTC